MNVTNHTGFELLDSLDAARHNFADNPTPENAELIERLEAEYERRERRLY